MSEAAEILLQIMAPNEKLGCSRTVRWAHRTGVYLGPLRERAYAPCLAPFGFYGVPGRCEFAPLDAHGVLALALEVPTNDDQGLIDVVAFDLVAPERFGTLLGAADVLGAVNVVNPGTCHRGKPLRLHRTPLTCIKAGCVGAVPLTEAAAAGLCGAEHAPVAAQDREDWAAFVRLTLHVVEPSTVLMPAVA